MGLTDSLSGTMKVALECTLTRTISELLSGKDNLEHTVTKSITDGTGANQASCWLTGSVTATTGGVTLSLGDSADPFGAAGDDIPTADPEGLKLRTLVIENTDSANFVTVGLGTNGLAGWLAGTTPTVRIDAGGFAAHSWPSGNSSALNDGVNDEIKITANTASVICKVSVLYG